MSDEPVDLSERWKKPKFEQLLSGWKTQLSQRRSELLSIGEEAVSLTGHHDLRGINLSNVSISMCDFEDCDLSYGCFDGCRFDGVYFTNVIAAHTSFVNAVFSGHDEYVLIRVYSSLYGISAANANFSGADLRNICLQGANLRGANFSGANLEGADFSGAMIDGACFSNSRLRHARFIHCDLSTVDFSLAETAEVIIGS